MKTYSYTKYRLAKRKDDIVQQKRNKTVTEYTKWWNPMYLEYASEYTEWEDIPFEVIE